MSRQRVNLWQEAVTQGQRGRERWRWRAPQEVIATICGRASMWAWESRVGTHCSSTSLLWHRDETLRRTTRLHVALTHAQIQEDVHTHTHTHTWPRAATEHFSSIQRFNPADIKVVIWHFAVLNICFTMFRSCQKAFMGGFMEWEMHLSLVGWLRTKGAILTKGIKAKREATAQSSQTDQTLLSCSSCFKSLKHTRHQNRTHRLYICWPCHTIGPASHTNYPRSMMLEQHSVAV